LSLRIYDIRSVDDTLNEFWVEVQDPKAHFGAFLGLSEGNSVSIDGNRHTTLGICIELQNSELYNGISACGTDEVRIGNVINRALFASRTGCSIDADLEFISSHSYEIKKPAEALRSFNVATIFELFRICLWRFPVRIHFMIVLWTVFRRIPIFQYCLSAFGLNIFHNLNSWSLSFFVEFIWIYESFGLGELSTPSFTSCSTGINEQSNFHWARAQDGVCPIVIVYAEWHYGPFDQHMRWKRSYSQRGLDHGELLHLSRVWAVQSSWFDIRFVFRIEKSARFVDLIRFQEDDGQTEFLHHPDMGEQLG
jgi:hypothetical protein